VGEREKIRERERDVEDNHLAALHLNAPGRNIKFPFPPKNGVDDSFLHFSSVTPVHHKENFGSSAFPNRVRFHTAVVAVPFVRSFSFWCGRFCLGEKNPSSLSLPSIPLLTL